MPERAHSRDRAVSLGATILGSCLVRLAGAATGVMLGFMLANMHRRGGGGESSAMAISLLMIAFNASELVGAPLAGLLIDRLGLRPLLLAGPVLGVIAEFMLAAPPRLGLLVIARLVQGLTAACTIPAALAYLSDSSGKLGERGRLMGFFEVGSVGGLAIGYTVGGLLWDRLHRAGFFDLLVIYGFGIGCFLLVQGKEKRPTQVHGLDWRALRHAADLMPAWLALNAAAGVWFGQAAYQLSGAHPVPNQLLSVGFSGRTIGIIFGVYTLLFAIGTISWGLVIGRVSIAMAMRIGAIGVVLAAVSILGINHASHFGGLQFRLPLAIGVIALAAETAFTPAALTLLAARSDAVPERRGALMGIYSTLLAGGQLIGAAIGGVFAMAWGIDGLVLATACLGILGFLTLPSVANTLNTGLSRSDWRGSERSTS